VAIHLAQYAGARSFAWLFGAFPPEQNLRTAGFVADTWARMNPQRLARARAGGALAQRGDDAWVFDEIEGMLVQDHAPTGTPSAGTKPYGGETAGVALDD